MPDGDAFLANPQRAVAEVIADVVAPPPPVDLNHWAVNNVRFASESRFPGPYNPDRFPFFTRPLEVLGPEHPARVVVIRKSAQLGGTVLAQIFLAGCMDLDPGGFLYIHPTEPNATKWAKQKWKPMVRQSVRLRELLPAAKGRDATNSTLYQERRDGRGFLQITGANSEASLSMVSVKRQVQDDLAKWELNSAGDPETQADSRSKAFNWAKILKVGTPLVEPGCRVTKAFMRSTQEYYHVPCPDPDCGHMHPLEWANMQAYIEAHPDSEPCFTCPACGGVIEQRHRAEMNRRGQWIADNPGAKWIGFHIWSAYSPLEDWVSIADAWAAAKGTPSKEQAFLNDTVGLAYKAAGESPPWEDLVLRAEASERKRGVIEVGGLLLTFGIDCQVDRVEWQLVAFGREFRRYPVDHGVIDGHIGDKSTRDALDALLRREWPDSFNGRRTMDMAAIDGNAWTEDVFDWAKRWPASKVMMVRGVKSEMAPPLMKVKREKNREGKSLKYAGRFYNVGVNGMKMALYKNLSKGDPLERGYVGFPCNFEPDYYQQLCAERRVPVKNKTGFEEFRWQKDPNQRNEMLDTMMYAEAAAYRLGWYHKSPQAWDALTAEIEVQRGGQAEIEDLLLMPAPTANAAMPQASPAVQSPASKLVKGLA